MSRNTFYESKDGDHINMGYGPHFDLIEIGLKGNVAIINGDTGFWTLVDKKDSQEVLFNKDFMNSFLSKEETFKKEMDSLRFGLIPSAVYFNPTERCNLNCKYCYLPGEMRLRGEDMTHETFKSAISILKDYFNSTLPSGGRKPEIVFHGSEPMMNKEVVFEGIEKFSDDFRFGVQTNATLLRNEDIEFLKRYNVGIGISLDAHIPQISDKVRKNWKGEGIYKKVLGIMEKLSDYPGFNVICTVTSYNVQFLPEIIDFFHKFNVDLVMLNPVRCTQEGGKNLKPENHLLAEKFIQALDLAYELYEKTGRKIVISNFANVIISIIAPTARSLMCDISPCGGGRCFFAVSAKGDIFPCSEFLGISEFNGGNLFSKNISEIIKSEPFKKITSRKVENIEPCSTCAIRHFCGAPCPAEIYALKGNLNAPSPYCQFFIEQVRYAFKIIKEGKEDAYLWDGWNEDTKKIFQLNAI